MVRLWTRRQSVVLAALVLIAAAALLVRAVRQPLRVPERLEGSGPLAERLADRIDPNTATWETLSLLPGMGQQRARQIVEFREKFIREYPGRAAFSKAEDLLRVDGVGVAIMEQISPYMRFGGE